MFITYEVFRLVCRIRFFLLPYAVFNFTDLLIYFFRAFTDEDFVSNYHQIKRNNCVTKYSRKTHYIMC